MNGYIVSQEFAYMAVDRTRLGALAAKADASAARAQFSRRLEREAQRNVELMWLTERLAPDFKAIDDFRKHNDKAIQATCRDFVMICRRLGLFSQSVMAIDGSKFKAVNNQDRNLGRNQVRA